MHHLTIKTRVFQVPSTVNELTGSQHAWLNQPGQKLTPWTVFFRLVNHPRNSFRNRLWLAWWILYNNYLIDLLDRWSFRLFTWSKSEIPLLQWYDLVHLCTEFVATDQTPFLMVPFRRLLWYTSPGDACKYLSFGEFLEADQALDAYLESMDEADLNQLVAYLYLPLGARLWPWLRRRLGEEEAVNARAKRLGKVSLSKRISVSTYYAGSRKALTLSHPHVFPPVDPDAKTSKKSTIREDYRDWFNSIAETPLNHAATYLLPIWQVVSSMESKILEAKRIEAELKKSQPR